MFRPRLSPGSMELRTNNFGLSLNKSNMTREEYRNAVLQAKEHILAGDIFQIVLSQRFEKRTFADPFEIYRALRVINPSPYMSYLQVCSSLSLKELFLDLIICLWFFNWLISLMLLLSGKRMYFSCFQPRNSYAGKEGNITFKILII